MWMIEREEEETKEAMDELCKMICAKRRLGRRMEEKTCCAELK